MLMTLATIEGYAHVWQLPLLLLYVCAWLIGGTYLTRWALRRHAGVPRSKATMARSFRVNFLSGGAGNVGAGTVLLFFMLLCQRGETVQKGWAIVGVVLAPVVMLGMSWLVQMNILSVAPKVLGRMVCVTTVPLLVLMGILGAGTWVKARQTRMENVGLARCEKNLRNLNKHLSRWANLRLSVPAPDLETIVDGVNVRPEQLRCPGSHSDRPGYLYVSVPDERQNPDNRTSKLRLADRRGNHPGRRVVVYADNRTDVIREEEFQRLLELPENAAMREKDRQDK